MVNTMTQEIKQNQKVFVLGAGFSKAISDLMPSLGELSKLVRNHIEIPTFLTKLGDNIELWLTYLAQPQPWLKEENNLQNRALFLRITKEIARLLENAESQTIKKSCPDWTNNLVEWWHTHKSSVISFNYDTLVERIPHRGVEYIYPMRLEAMWPPRTIVDGIYEGESFKLLKLHGSVNWYYSGSATYYGQALYYHTITRWSEDLRDENKSKKALRALTPLIIPPTTEKTLYFQHEMINHIWQQAYSALNLADEVIFIGSSLPETDLGVKFLMHQARQAGKIKLTIVNVDNSVVERYKTALSTGYEIDSHLVGLNSVQTLVKELANLR